MVRLTVALGLAVALVPAAVGGRAGARAVPAARAANAAPAPACHATLRVIAHGQGSPDDLVWAGRRLLVSDIKKGTVGAVARGHVRTLIAHIREPEGIVPGPHHSLLVAEQATDRVLEVNPATGSRKVLVKLRLPHGQSGLDGINADGPGAIFVPDSARGRLYVLHLGTGRLSLVARGMKRPVAAIRWAHGIAVADEYSNAVWMIAGGKRKRLGAIPLPDDLAVISGHLVAVSLVGQVWEVAPHLRLLSSAFGPTTTDPQGLAPDGPGAVVVADEARNAIYRLGRLGGCL